jgi:hypothetical protein
LCKVIFGPTRELDESIDYEMDCTERPGNHPRGGGGRGGIKQRNIHKHERIPLPHIHIWRRYRHAIPERKRKTRELKHAGYKKNLVKA